MQENKNNNVNDNNDNNGDVGISKELKEIRKKQYEDNLLRNRKKISKGKKINREVKEANENEIMEEKKPLLEKESTTESKEQTPKKTENININNDNNSDSNIKKNDNSSIENNIKNNHESNNENISIDLVNERRKNRGFESKDSKLKHILFILYYHIKTIFTFIYMYFKTLINPDANKKYSQKKKKDKFSSFDTYNENKNKKTIDASYMGFGMCCNCGGN